MIEAWDRKNNSEAENVKWLMVNTKKCPSCKKFIEKNQGCNHMTCRKEAGGCGYEFCWICMGEWLSHTKDYYNCNKFDTEKAKKMEEEGKNAKFELEKYVFYFNRWMNHQKALLLALKMRNTIKNTIREFKELKLISYEDLKFLENAVEVIVKCRRTLKNTYVFGFYMQDTATQKPLFEHNQYLLEKNADRLHELMENEQYLPKIFKTENFDEFNKLWANFKGEVVNLSTATLKYKENLLSEIETNMLDIVNFKLLV
jgi:ariadne-1